MIKFIGEEDLLEIKNNTKILFRDVIQKEKPIEEVFNNDKLIRETNIPADNFKLDVSADKPELTDFENVQRVYTNMRALSESQASDERIWSAYTLSVFSEYMLYRWYPETETAMMNRYFFSYTPKRSLFRNGIARLWWIGHLTYRPDIDRDSRFEYTEYICRKQDNINLLLDINFGNNRDVLHAVIHALIDAENTGMKIERGTVRKLSEYINTLGGTYLIDALSPDVIYEKSMGKLLKLAESEAEQINE